MRHPPRWRAGCEARPVERPGAAALSTMHRDTRDVLRVALERFGSDGAAEFFETFGDTPARRLGESRVSRQARHARAQRQRGLAAAGALAIAYEDPDALPALLTPAFAELRPYSAQVHTRMLHLAEHHGAFSSARSEALWNTALARYVDLGRRAHALDRDGLLALQTLQMVMAPSFHLLPREHARSFFRQLLQEARRTGLWDNPSCRLWIAISGSHAGEPGHHVDWLLDSRTRAFDLVDTLCFVRRDAPEDLLELSAMLVRGDTLTADRWAPAVEDAPLAVWMRLAEYVRSCSRMAVHCQNEGQVLMVLSWVGDLHRRVRGGGSLRPGTLRLFQALRAIESVQIVEKNRFLDVLSSSSPKVRDTLGQLWRLSAEPPPP